MAGCSYSGENQDGNEAVGISMEAVDRSRRRSPMRESKFCIFRIPPSFVDDNIRAYEPNIVSIGPYHHGKPHLQMMQRHKERVLESLVARTNGLVLQDFFNIVKEYESFVRGCYSEDIPFNSDRFVAMLVIDGCFVLEIFRKIAGEVPLEEDDPFLMPGLFNRLVEDLISLENQIPLEVLRALYSLIISVRDDEAGSDDPVPKEQNSESLLTKALFFFEESSFELPEGIWCEHIHLVCGRHLLGMLWKCYLPQGDLYLRRPGSGCRVIIDYVSKLYRAGIEQLMCRGKEDPPARKLKSAGRRVIHCISKLRGAGIKVKCGSTTDSFLNIRFHRGVIQMPPIKLDYLMCAFLRNCVAYEQCQSVESRYMTTYVAFLDCLIDSYKDVEYLCASNVFDNYFGKEAEVATFVNKIGKNVMRGVHGPTYMSQQFDDVGKYYRKYTTTWHRWHLHWATFKTTYFDSPWSFISAATAFVLLFLTIVQTIYAVLSYHHAAQGRRSGNISGQPRGR
ncbi:unnamed protein product [Cuscuta epithymum]|uniref:Uncharacterized protein n=1 Tax=Cuscuta epithymum TaxID=186058 RepID=A0AAV0EL67_9ASTE|nr:unnamed protein product [Cuscuta epithymum]